jgi:FOG: TPR repeat, SEL1 subfamily
MGYDFEKLTTEELDELCERFLQETDGQYNYSAAAAAAGIAAERGDAKGLYLYGSLLIDGNGVEQDIPKGLECWRKSGEMGYAPANDRLGFCLMSGICGVRKDPASAVVYFKKAAEAGHADSMFHLAMMYGIGTGVEKDEAESDKYLSMAAEKKLPVACMLLARKKLSADNRTAEDLQEAAALLLTAAEGNNTEAQLLYGVCCEKGIGVEKDLAEASGWYRRAAKAGSQQANEALINLGFSGVM